MISLRRIHHALAQLLGSPVQTRPELQPIRGASRGFEVRGFRATPPVPSVPTITEILEGRTRRAA